MAEQPVTTLLMDWRKGNRDAGKELLARMQQELRRIAAAYMQKEHLGHTLQATALVNELYLRLMGGAVVEWQDRAHFLAVAAQQLRRVDNEWYLIIECAGHSPRIGGLKRPPVASLRRRPRPT